MCSSDLPSPTPPVSQEQKADQQETPPSSTADNLTIKLIGNQLCWVRVTVDGEIQFEGNLDSEETKEFEAEESVQVRLGNAGGVDVIYNGKKEPPLGESGQVVEKEYTKSS